MKRAIFCAISSCSILLAAVSGTAAQTTGNEYAAYYFTAAGTPRINDLHTTGKTDRTLPVNMNALRNFSHTFKNAKNVQWFNSEDGMMAYFTQNGVKMRSGYDSRGRWLYTMLFYTEAFLPDDIRGQVKSIYYDYSIMSVNEIRKEQKTIYLVHLHEQGHWKTVRICEGEEMETVEDFSEQ